MKASQKTLGLVAATGALVLGTFSIGGAAFAANGTGETPTPSQSTSSSSNVVDVSAQAGGPAVSKEVQPGQAADVTLGGFAANETVTYSLTGDNAQADWISAASIAHFAVKTATKSFTASAAGTGNVKVTLPKDATGNYSLKATGKTSGKTATVDLKTGIPALASTGADSGVTTALLLGGGALVAAGAVAVGTMTARRRAQAKK